MILNLVTNHEFGKFFKCVQPFWSISYERVKISSDWNEMQTHNYLICKQIPCKQM